MLAGGDVREQGPPLIQPDNNREYFNLNGRLYTAQASHVKITYDWATVRASVNGEATKVGNWLKLIFLSGLLGTFGEFHLSSSNVAKSSLVLPRDLPVFGV